MISSNEETEFKVISSFSGKYRFLSNFQPVWIILDEKLYPTVEHAYQAAKSTLDLHREMIRKAETPGKAKRLGNRNPLRPDWEDVKVSIMENLLRQKFLQHDLRSKLILYKDYYIIEGNNWNDTFWGVCKGRGENHLGRIIMKIRDEILER